MPIENNHHRVVYWDACCFVSLIEGTPDRLPVLEAVAEDAERGSLQIYTSVLSVAEVAFATAEKAARVLDPAVEETIERLWRPASPFRLVEVFPALTVRARRLIRASVSDGGAILKPADAIHLAAAERAGAAVLHTYDRKLRKAGRLCPFPVAEPTTDRIVWPETES